MATKNSHWHSSANMTCRFFQVAVEESVQRRRRALSACIEGVRRVLSDALIDPDDKLRLTDSAPIPVCTYQRGNTCQTVSGAAYCSVMASRKAKLFGFHLDFTTTLNQVVDEWMLAPAAPRDNKMAEPLLADAYDLWVCGDNAYRDPGVTDRLKAKHGITSKRLTTHSAKAVRQSGNQLMFLVSPIKPRSHGTRRGSRAA